MNESDLRTQLRAIASAAVPAPRPLPRRVESRARRGRTFSGLLATGVVGLLLVGGFYAVGSTRNLVGPAPIAGGSDQGVVDPPDHSFGSSVFLNAEVVDGRICALFELQVREFEDHRAHARICDPDPTAVLSIVTRLVIFQTEPPGGFIAMSDSPIVAVAGGVGPEVARVEIDLPGNRLPDQRLPLMSVKDFGRRVTGSALERNLMLDDNGKFSAVIRALDSQGNVIVEQRLCDPTTSSDPSCGE